MGCDIHFYVEKRMNGTWKIQGELRDDDGYKEIVGQQFYSDRNYNLFAILADVRNGRGFAGIKMGEGFNPIDDPRGVPADASAEYIAISDEAGVDGHSHSYHTLRDLLNLDWTQETGLQGWCDMATWEKWSRYDRGAGQGPVEYCGSVDGASIRHIDAVEADALFAGKTYQERQAIAAANSRTYALAKWRVSYHRAAGSFWSETMPKLLALAGGVSGVDDVRIVFFFDN